MELRQLNYFKEACELRNFSEAARVLNISQSTLSQQIKQLEEELGILLFDRIGKRVVPTEAGLALLPYAHRAIQEAEDGRQMIRDLKGVQTGRLHVGVTYSMISFMLPALERFTQHYPGVEVHVTQGTSEELLQLLGDNGLDLLLSFKPESMCNDLETVPIVRSELYFVTHHSHRLASLSSITLKRLAATPLILPERGFATRKRIEELCRKYRLSAGGDTGPFPPDDDRLIRASTSHKESAPGDFLPGRSVSCQEPLMPQAGASRGYRQMPSSFLMASILASAATLAAS